MARTTCKLTALAVQKTTAPGRYADGGGLYLQIGPTGSKSWLFRYTKQGRSREMGLGAVGPLSLADARIKALEARQALAGGIDPIEARKAGLDRLRLEKARGMTFIQCANTYIDAHNAGWRNAKHAAQWSSTIKTYVEPVFGHIPVQDVDLPLVLKVLEPIWKTKPETAGRLRGRIESILDWATVRGYRQGENPARWKGYLNKLLPARSKIRTVRHHAALPHADVSTFMGNLRQRTGTAALALEFTILTAARTNEVLGAKWEEIDLETMMWAVPGERMKSGRPHRVPLSAPAVLILKAMAGVARGDYVFPGNKKDQPLSNMVFLQLLKRMDRTDITAHGFRSTFRDWASECTSFSRETAEAALAHVVGDKVEAAYRRGDQLEKRRKLMDAWSGYCAKARKPAEIVEFRAAV